MPPLVGPRASLYWQRKPWNVLVPPRSMRTGIETWRNRWGSRRYWCMALSRPIALAALSNWAWAMRNGLSSSVPFAAGAGAWMAACFVMPFAFPLAWPLTAVLGLFGAVLAADLRVCRRVFGMGTTRRWRADSGFWT